ncbi:MAG: type IV pilus modification protein PilV [Rhodoferax sp.]
MPHRPFPLSTQRGVALIEVMIAFLVLSVGLLGYSMLQVRALKATQSSMQRTEASILAANILEAMRANKSAAVHPSHPYNVGSRTCSTPSTDGSLVQNDVNAWFVSLQSALGGTSTCADITCSDSASAAPGVCTINVYWDDSRALGGSGNQSIQVVGRL